MKIRITPAEYQENDWIVHELAHDFVLRDAWCLPVKIEGPFRDFLQFFLSVDPMESSLIVKLLFQFRFSLGNIFALDDQATCIPQTEESSIKVRLKRPESFDLPLPNNSFNHFHPVYLRDNESLFEISNKTIFALIHLGKKDKEVWMGVYTKSFGFLSDFYMGVIKPFRHFIVYPLWLNYLRKEWETRGIESH